MFDQKQIGEFKEAFSLIDHDNDGFLDKEDIKDMLASLGKSMVCHCIGIDGFWNCKLPFALSDLLNLVL